MNVCIFTGGEYPAPESAASFFERLPDFVIAADSGLDAAEMYGSVYGFVPDLIIGDMDSLSEPEVRLSLYEPSRIKRFIRDKNYTDTELALKEAYGLCAASGDQEQFTVMLVGGDGGRVDHLFSIRNLFGTDLTPHIWLCRTQAVFYIDSEKRNQFAADGVLPCHSISVFPAGDLSAPHCSRSENLLWPLDKVSWNSGQYSLSNRFSSTGCCSAAGSISITAESGSFIVIVPLRLRSALY